MKTITTLAAAGLLSFSNWCVAAEPAKVQPPLPFTGIDYSGVYDCKGVDSHEGEYTATVTLTRNKAQSSGAFGAYEFRMEVPNYGTYLGQAVSNGRHIAIHFALTDPAPKDYGTGLAIATPKGKKQSFRKFYYEPEFKGGNFGNEECVQR